MHTGTWEEYLKDMDSIGINGKAIDIEKADFGALHPEAVWSEAEDGRRSAKRCVAWEARQREHGVRLTRRTMGWHP